MPPVATGIARCSADLVVALDGEHDIDIFVDQRNLGSVSSGARFASAHDFAWQHRQRPYDLIVYQLGNSSHHDYQWPYLFRHPGLVVLHDVHLHHARAACLLRTFRADDYRTEFAWNHPEASVDLAEVAVAGFDNHFHYAWPMTRAVVEHSRLVAVHSAIAAESLRESAKGGRIRAIQLGHGTLLTDAASAEQGARARARYAIPPDAFVFGSFGALTPDKRIPQILSAFAATRAHVPSAHLLLAGAVTGELDVRRLVERLGLRDSCTVTGYLPDDADLTGCIAASDVTLNLRWPTAREVSGPWLRCIAAGRPTVTMDLAHMADVPSIDPRTWRSNAPGGEAPCTVAIDILDEDHSLRLAMRRLATDASLRASLGRAARQYWLDKHSIDVMVAGYRTLIAEALDISIAAAPLPPHLVQDGGDTLRRLAMEFTVPLPLRL
jgi:glycosyltransferase involved in cell wall biosynthesis